MSAVFPNARTLRNRTERQERVVLALKYVSDELARSGETSLHGITSGKSLRIVARTEADGRTSISSSLYSRVHRQRASGKGYHYWAADKITNIARTKQDLLVLRDIDRRGSTRSSHVFSDHSWLRPVSELTHEFARWVRLEPGLRQLEGPPSAELLDEIGQVVDRAIADIRTHLGALPTHAERFPLWAFDTRVNEILAPAAFYMPYLDAEDYAQVAKNMFGVRAYRKPLAGLVERVDPQTLLWFQLFRGLVPIDWVIDALNGYEAQQAQVLAKLTTPSGRAATQQRQQRSLRQLRAHFPNAQARRTTRQILRQLPQAVLRRILREPVAQASLVMSDAAQGMSNKWGNTRDMAELSERIAARGQRKLRSSRDIEQLVHSLPVAQAWSNARSHSAGRALVEESQQHADMLDYNQQIARLPEGAAPVATWELWKDVAFRQAADALLTERRRELMTAREREYEVRAERDRLKRLEQQAERHAWAVELAGRIDGSVVLADPQLWLVVAQDAQTLRRWGGEMHHCIGTYSHELGLDVFATVQDSAGVAKVAMQITQGHGVRQILGKYNCDARDALGVHAQPVIDALVTLGIEIESSALGMAGLQVPSEALEREHIRTLVAA